MLFNTNAQGKLEFFKESHDFGEIEEEGGHAEYIFNFVNTGDQSIQITDVKASCGCTTPGWTKEETAPRDSGFVRVRFNPRNRPGRFTKSLRISSTQTSENKVLYISGFVKPKSKSILEELPVNTGDLRIKYRSLNMGKMTTEKVVDKEFDVYNAGNDSLQLQYQLMQVPDHIKLTLKPTILSSKEKGVLKVSFDPKIKNDLGFLSDNVTIQTDTVSGVKNLFSVISTVEEFFPEMTAKELDEAPKLLISERVFDFGKVKEGTIVETAFTLNNGGKKKLNFRKIKSNCDCVTYEVTSQSLKKGQSQDLRIMFDTSARRGTQYKTVTIFSNDPSDPAQMVTIKGSVQKN